jgi:hypothetical protein
VAALWPPPPPTGCFLATGSSRRGTFGFCLSSTGDFALRRRTGRTIAMRTQLQRRAEGGERTVRISKSQTWCDGRYNNCRDKQRAPGFRPVPPWPSLLLPLMARRVARVAARSTTRARHKATWPSDGRSACRWSQRPCLISAAVAVCLAPAPHQRDNRRTVRFSVFVNTHNYPARALCRPSSPTAPPEKLSEAPQPPPDKENRRRGGLPTPISTSPHASSIWRARLAPLCSRRGAAPDQPDFCIDGHGGVPSPLPLGLGLNARGAVRWLLVHCTCPPPISHAHSDGAAG